MQCNCASSYAYQKGEGALRAALDEAEAAVGAATAREAERAARAPALRARIEALRAQGRRADEATR